MVVRRTQSKIIRVAPEKVTKLIFVDAVGVDAAAAGIKEGDLVLPLQLRNVVPNTDVFRPFVDEESVGFVLTDYTLEDFLVQTEDGTDFVAFDAPEAAIPLGKSAPQAAGAL